jgi:hypothetical protein
LIGQKLAGQTQSRVQCVIDIFRVDVLKKQNELGGQHSRVLALLRRKQLLQQHCRITDADVMPQIDPDAHGAGNHLFARTGMLEQLGETHSSVVSANGGYTASISLPSIKPCDRNTIFGKNQ